MSDYDGPYEPVTFTISTGYVPKPYEIAFARAVVGCYPGDLVGSPVVIARTMMPDDLGKLFRALTALPKETI